MWELLLRMILDTVTENRGVQVEFYNRFQYTVEVSGFITTSSSLASLAGTATVFPPRRAAGLKRRVNTVNIIIPLLSLFN